MPTQLASSGQLQFIKAENPKDCGPIAERLGDKAVHELALCLYFVPQPEEFAEMLAKGVINIWRCVRPATGETVAWAIDVYRFDDHEMFVWCKDGWDNALVGEILASMAEGIFTADKAAIRIWMVIPVPLPVGSEEMLMSLGFDPWRDDLGQGHKQTYGLDRTTWLVYTGQTPA